MSRSGVAKALGVSSTSIQNWETGHAVATAKVQQRLADLMSAPATSSPTPTASAAAAAPGPAVNGNPTLIQSTAAIVIEAIRVGGKKNLSARELGLLVRTVRDALA